MKTKATRRNRENGENMSTEQSLASTATKNGLNLRFQKSGRLWEAKDTRGKVIWCGSIKDMRTIAKGGAIK